MSCTSIAFSAVNQLLLCSAGLDQRILFFDTTEKKAVKQLDCSYPLTSLGFHSDGYTVAAGNLYGTILLFDLRASSTPKTILKGHGNNPVTCVEFARWKKPKDIKKPPSSASVAVTENQYSSIQFLNMENLQTVKKADKAKDSVPGSNSRAAELITPIDSQQTTKSKWKTIEQIREEAKRNVEQRMK